ncbi:MAG: hypothetical protein LUH41_06065 [Clostridiales bacterium]|nr:hypothetical protein [Clostridiales bacterium]
MKSCKKLLSILCALALALSVTACSSTDSEDTSETDTATETETTETDQVEETSADTETETQVGQITAIDGSTVTLQLGELTEMSGGGFDGGMPDGEGGDFDGELPEGDSASADGEAPELPDGEEMGDGEAPDDLPDRDGEAPSGDGEAPDDLPTDGEGRDFDGDFDGEMPEGGDFDGEMPEDGDFNGEMPEGGDFDGELPDGQGGGMSGGGFGGSGFTAGDETLTLDLTDVTITLSDGETGSVSDLAVDDILQIEYDADGAVSSVTVLSLTGGMGGGDMGGSFGGSGEVEQGTAANTIDEDGDYSGGTYTSTGDDENALRVDGATVTLDGITVDKSAGATSNTETGDFYGMNAALLATDGADVTITNATVTSSAQNGNGVFSYGEGTTVTISDSAITTTADNSGGIQTTGGGATVASNLTVETSGSSSAAIRSDRGGGTVNVDGGTYTTNGYNSPAVYSTADITVSNATLTANSSEALVIEGENSIALTDCDVYGNMSDTQGTSSDENVHSVMIYQSMSGDAEVGTSTFSMTGGTLTSNNGDVFYVTNTHCVLTLAGVTIVNNETDGNLMTITGNSASHGWGSAGANGAQVEFTADGQTLEGAVMVDTISTLEMTLTNGSDFTGTVNIVENAEGGDAVEDNAVITVEVGCTWTLTGDCTVTSLTNNGTINFNGYTITLADGTVLSE